MLGGRNDISPCTWHWAVSAQLERYSSLLPRCSFVRSSSCVAFPYILAPRHASLRVCVITAPRLIQVLNYLVSPRLSAWHFAAERSARDCSLEGDQQAGLHVKVTLGPQRSFDVFRHCRGASFRRQVYIMMTCVAARQHHTVVLHEFPPGNNKLIHRTG